MEEKKKVKVTMEMPDGEVVVLEGDYASINVGSVSGNYGGCDTTTVVYAHSYNECYGLYFTNMKATHDRATQIREEEAKKKEEGLNDGR